MDDVYINIVMEYCNAGDLAGLIKRRQGNLLPESEVMSLFVQVSSGSRGSPSSNLAVPWQMQKYCTSSHSAVECALLPTAAAVAAL